jgi:undecaprenyl-diphosphatase
MNNLISILKKIDERLFFFINGKHSELSDNLATLASNKLSWIPLYLVVLIFLYKKFKNKIYAILPLVALLILTSDQLSRLIKNIVQRYRPCHNIEFKNVVHLVNNDCGGIYGFVSSHAANSMALSLFIIMLFGIKNKAIMITMFIYCALVSLSRIMLGRHYPLDIAGGWLVGIVSSLFIYFLFNKLVIKKNNIA